MRGLASEPRKEYRYKSGYKVISKLVLIKEKILKIQDLNIKHALTKEELLKRITEIEIDIYSLKQTIKKDN